MNDQNSKIASEIINYFNFYLKAEDKKQMSIEENIEKYRSFVQRRIQSKRSYTSLSLSPFKRLITAFICPNGNFGEDFIMIDIFDIDECQISKKIIINEIEGIKSFFNNSNHKIKIRLLPHQVKAKVIFTDIGFKIDAYDLWGSIDISIDKLKNNSLKQFNDLEIKLLNLQDIELLLEIEKKCLQAESKKNVRNDLSSAKALSSLSQSYKTMVESSSIIGIMINNKLAGYGGIILDETDTAHIATIGVTPKFRGNQISKFIYLKLLEIAKKNQKVFYRGETRNEKIISIGRLLDRKVVSTIFEY